MELPIEQIRVLAGQMEAAQGNAEVIVDLESETVTAPEGEVIRFKTPAVLRRMLLDGVDEIGVTLARAAEIDAFRTHDRSKRPWAY